MSTRGFVGQRGGPEPRNLASSDKQDTEDDSDDVEALKRRRGGTCVGFETGNRVNACKGKTTTTDLETAVACFGAASSTSADVERLARLRE